MYLRIYFKLKVRLFYLHVAIFLCKLLAVLPDEKCRCCISVMIQADCTLNTRLLNIAALVRSVATLFIGLRKTYLYPDYIKTLLC